MSARAQPATDPTTPCIVPQTAGFSSLENQLYRVEIHTGGTLSASGASNVTFKWSRDNGSVAAAWLDSQGGPDTLTVQLTNNDPARGFAAEQWVELSDDQRDLSGNPGILVQLADVKGNILTIKPATATAPINRADFPLHPKVRRWDTISTNGTVPVTLGPATNQGFIALEDGVEVSFRAGTYRSGDYWMIPARTITGQVEWPADPTTGAPAAISPHGIIHHFASLASFFSPGFTSLRDHRRLFASLTDQSIESEPESGEVRYYLVDGVSGDDGAGVPGVSLDPAFALADARPFASLARVASLLPRAGNDSTAVILIRPFPDTRAYGDFILNGISGYRKLVIRGSDFTNTATDQLVCGAKVVDPFTAGIAVAQQNAGEELVLSITPAAPGLGAEPAVIGRRVRFSDTTTTAALRSRTGVVLAHTATSVLLDVALAPAAAVAGDSLFLERPGVRVGTLAIGTATAGGGNTFATSVAGLSAAKIDLSGATGTVELAFCEADTFVATVFGSLKCAGDYGTELGTTVDLGAGLRAGGASALDQGRSISFAKSALLAAADLKRIGSVALGAGVFAIESHVTQCGYFTVGVGGSFRRVRIGLGSPVPTLQVNEASGAIQNVQIDLTAAGLPSIVLTGNGRALSIDSGTVVPGAGARLLSLTASSGAEVVIDPNAALTAAITLSTGADFPPSELTRTDVIDSAGNHVQAPGGSFVQKGLALAASGPITQYSVTRYTGTGSPNEQQVTPALAAAPDPTAALAGVAQQALLAAGVGRTMHVTGGYSLVRLDQAAAASTPALPAPIFLSGATAGAITFTAAAVSVPLGVLVRRYPDGVGLARLRL